MKNSLVFFLIGSLLLIPLQISNAVTPKSGATCSKLNQTQISGIYKFTCVKSGKKLVWSKGKSVKISTPTTLPVLTANSTPTPNPSTPSDSGIKYDETAYAEPQTPSMPIQDCKIQENSDQGNLRGDLASGFPFMKRFETYSKKIKMAIIPIDFSDLPGELDFKARIQSQTKSVSDWYEYVSEGKLSISWEIQNEWIRLPGFSTDYAVPFSGSYPETYNFWKKVLPIIDSKVDLSGIQTINFILPSGQTVIKESVQSFPFLNEMKDINSTKTQLISFTAAGTYFDSPVRTYWSYWAHEFGHVLGLAHLGSSRGSSQPINGYDLLGNQDGPYRELSGWMRFIIGWLDDNQVYCQNIDNFTSNEFSLVPLSESKPGIKLIVIPTSKESAIVIDSRRPTKFSCDAPNLPSGVLVYTYDAKLGNQSYFLEAKYPNNRLKTIKCTQNERMEMYPDALLHKGDVIQVGNLSISVISSGNYDQISIKRN